MKIAFIGGRGLPETYSGLEVFLKELCSMLVERGHDITVYCRSKYFRVDSYNGIRLVKVPCIDTKLLGTMTHSFFSTIMALKDKHDIYHFNAIGPSVFASITRITHSPSIVTMHSLNWKHAKWNYIEKFLIKLFEFFSIHFPNTVVAVAKQHQLYIQARYHKKAYYIPNGVNVTEHKLPDEIKLRGIHKGSYILYVGRLSPEKGCHYLINAFNNLENDKKLVIAGDVKSNEKYKKILMDNANERVLFLGHVSQKILAELYCNSLVYVLPSESEGLSFSLLEAMSYGCCVLASAIRENMDVIDDCGVLFEVGNVEMLTEKLAMLLGNEKYRSYLGQKAKTHVSRLFNWENICTQYELLYEELLK